MVLDKLKKLADRARGKAAPLAEKAAEKAGPLAAQAAQKAAEAAAQAKEKAGPLAAQAKEKASDLASKAAPHVSHGVDVAAGGIDKATGGRFSDKIETVQGKVHDTVDKAAPTETAEAEPAAAASSDETVSPEAGVADVAPDEKP
jgi:hypothetical protein